MLMEEQESLLYTKLKEHIKYVLDYKKNKQFNSEIELPVHFQPSCILLYDTKYIIYARFSKESIEQFISDYPSICLEHIHDRKLLLKTYQFNLFMDAGISNCEIIISSFRPNFKEGIQLYDNNGKFLLSLQNRMISGFCTKLCLQENVNSNVIPHYLTKFEEMKECQESIYKEKNLGGLSLDNLPNSTHPIENNSKKIEKYNEEMKKREIEAKKKENKEKERIQNMYLDSINQLKNEVKEIHKEIIESRQEELQVRNNYLRSLDDIKGQYEELIKEVTLKNKRKKVIKSSLKSIVKKARNDLNNITYEIFDNFRENYPYDTLRSRFSVIKRELKQLRNTRGSTIPIKRAKKIATEKVRGILKRITKLSKEIKEGMRVAKKNSRKSTHLSRKLSSRKKRWPQNQRKVPEVKNEVTKLNENDNSGKQSIFSLPLNKNPS